MHRIGDIDIDVKSHTDKGQFGIRAIIYDEETKNIRPHPSGYYVYSNIPVDPETGMSAIDYKESEELGYVKIDLLTNTSYDHFNSKEEVLNALEREPNWDKLLDEKFVSKLPHVADHFDLLYEVKPKSIIELADVLALIRPGKTHLIESYLKNPDKTRPNLYRKPKRGFRFKKSHAIAYAAMIVCVMNKRDSASLITFR